MRGRERASGVFCFRAACHEARTQNSAATDISDFRGEAEFSLNLRRSSAYPMSMTPGNAAAAAARNRSCLFRHTSSVRVAGVGTSGSH